MSSHTAGWATAEFPASGQKVLSVPPALPVAPVTCSEKSSDAEIAKHQHCTSTTLGLLGFQTYSTSRFLLQVYLQPFQVFPAVSVSECWCDLSCPRLRFNLDVWVHTVGASTQEDFDDFSWAVHHLPTHVTLNGLSLINRKLCWAPCSNDLPPASKYKQYRHHFNAWQSSFT